MSVNNIVSFIHEYLFPARCAICHTMLLDGTESGCGLCADCAPLFTVPDYKRCALCGRRINTYHEQCKECRNGETRHSFDKVICLYPYTGLYRQLLSAYKFKMMKQLGNFLTEKIVEAFSLFSEPLDNFFLVPVPPRHGKMKSCGWDQVEFMACRLESMRLSSKSALLPVKRCLKRLPSPEQKQLNMKQRKVNITGHIICTKEAPRQVIVFDDVYTTGSTMDACAAALKTGGAKRVYGICLFHTELK